MSAHSGKKKRIGSRRRLENPNKIPVVENFHRLDSTTAAHFIPEESTDTLHVSADYVNSQFKTQNTHSTELAENRRKLGFSRRNRIQHIKNSVEPREEEDVEESGRANETPQAAQMLPLKQPYRKKEFSKGSKPYVSANLDSSLYSATDSFQFQNSIQRNSLEADVENLIPNSEQFLAGKGKSDTDYEVVQTALVGMALEEAHRSDNHMSDEDLASLKVLSCPPVHGKLSDQSISIKLMEENLCDVCPATTKDGNVELKQQEGNLGGFLVSELAVKSLGRQCSVTAELTTDETNPRKVTELKYDVKQDIFSTPNVCSEGVECTVHQQEAKAKEILANNLLSSDVTNDATGNYEIAFGNLRDQPEVNGTSQPNLNLNRDDAVINQEGYNPREQNIHDTKVSRSAALDYANDYSTLSISAVQREDSGQKYKTLDQAELLVKQADDYLTMKKYSFPDDRHDAQTAKENSLKFLDCTNEEYHANKLQISSTKKPDTENKVCEGQLKLILEQPINQEEQFFIATGESESCSQGLQPENKGCLDLQPQLEDEGCNSTGCRRKLLRSYQNKGREYVKDIVTELHHRHEDETVKNTEDNELLAAKICSITEKHVQENSMDTILGQVDIDQTAGVSGQIKENAQRGSLEQSSESSSTLQLRPEDFVNAIHEDTSKLKPVQKVQQPAQCFGDKRNRRKLGSSRRNKEWTHVKDSVTNQKVDPMKNSNGAEALETKVLFSTYNNDEKNPKQIIQKETFFAQNATDNGANENAEVTLSPKKDCEEEKNTNEDPEKLSKSAGYDKDMEMEKLDFMQSPEDDADMENISIHDCNVNAKSNILDPPEQGASSPGKNQPGEESILQQKEGAFKAVKDVGVVHGCNRQQNTEVKNDSHVTENLQGISQQKGRNAGHTPQKRISSDDGMKKRKLNVEADKNIDWTEVVKELPKSLSANISEGKNFNPSLNPLKEGQQEADERVVIHENGQRSTLVLQTSPALYPGGQSASSMEEVVTGNPVTPFQASFIEQRFVALCETTQATQNDDKHLETPNELQGKALKAAEPPVAVTQLEIVKSKVRGLARNEHKGDQGYSRELNRNEGLLNKNVDMKNKSPDNRRRKMGSSRRNLRSQREGEPFNQKKDKDVGDFDSESGSDQSKGAEFEVAQCSHTETTSGGRSKKLGSHRRLHGQGRGVKSYYEERSIKISEESLDENKMSEVTDCDEVLSQERRGEDSKPNSEKTPIQRIPIHHPSAELCHGQEAAAQGSKTYNVMMVGDSSVGKTSFMRRAQTGTFSLDVPSTVGLDCCMWTVVIDGKPVILQLWDTAGQERFHSITRQIFHKAQAFLLMYDITSSQSFTAVSYWADCIQEGAAENVAVLLLGNKCDCAERQVKTQEGNVIAKDYNFFFMECSAATGKNVTASLETVARALSQVNTREESMALHKESHQKNTQRCC